jgi:hypothetical protein
MHRQARKIATERLSRTSHTMLLEDQMVSNDEQKKMFEDKVEDLIRNIPNDFWADKE